MCLDAKTEIETLQSGRYGFRLPSGVHLTSGSAYRERVRQAFGLRAVVVPSTRSTVEAKPAPRHIRLPEQAG